MRLIEIFKGIMRYFCFSGIVLGISTIFSGRISELILSELMIGIGAYFGWLEFEEE